MYDPDILPLGVYPNKTMVVKVTWAPAFTVALFIIAIIGKQHNIHGWIHFGDILCI